MDTDYLDRTAMKHITDYEHVPLFASDTIDAFLDELWVGKESYECDGRTTDFSMLAYMSMANIRNLTGQKINHSVLWGPHIQPDSVLEENFWFQYKFRSKSIGFIFKKELLSTVVLTFILLLINYNYLINFNVGWNQNYPNSFVAF